MAEVKVTIATVGSRSMTANFTGTFMAEGIGSGGAGGTAGLSGGGGGKGGGYARRNAASVTNGQTISWVVPASATSSAGAVATVSVASTVVMSAQGGGVGGNGSLISGGSGSSATVGSAIGDVIFSSGNGGNGNLTSGGGGGSGAGSASNGNGGSTGVASSPVIQFSSTPSGAGGTTAADGTIFGGAGGGATTLSSRGAGASGGIRLTFDTGISSISPNALMSRKLTMFRTLASSISPNALMSRILLLARLFTGYIYPASAVQKKIYIYKISNISPLASIIKDIKAYRLANVSPTPIIRKFIYLFEKTAGISPNSLFDRAITVRRTFSSLVTAKSIREGLLIIFLPRTASISLYAGVQKYIKAYRLASTSIIPSTAKYITLVAKNAGITATPIFNRAVTVRRSFNASVRPLADLFVSLRARLIPRGEGGTTIVKKVITYLIDD